MWFKKAQSLLNDPTKNDVWPCRDGKILGDLRDLGAVQVGESKVHVGGADVHAEHSVPRAVERELP